MSEICHFIGVSFTSSPTQARKYHRPYIPLDGSQESSRSCLSILEEYLLLSMPGVGRRTWSAPISLRPIETSARTPSLAPNVHNIPIPSSPSSPHPLATVSSSGAPLSASAFPPLIVPSRVSPGAVCSERGGFEGPDPGTCHETSIGPTVGKLVPFAYPCFNPPP